MSAPHQDEGHCGCPMCAHSRAVGASLKAAHAPDIGNRGPYTVTRFGRLGPIDDRKGDWTAALATVEEWSREYPSNHIVVHSDWADGGYGDDGQGWDDGLTEDEDEEIELAQERGQAARIARRVAVAAGGGR